MLANLYKPWVYFRSFTVFSPKGPSQVFGSTLIYFRAPYKSERIVSTYMFHTCCNRGQELLMEQKQKTKNQSSWQYQKSQCRVHEVLSLNKTLVDLQKFQDCCGCIDNHHGNIYRKASFFMQLVQRRIWNPVKHLRWNPLQKFSKRFILDI